MDRAENDTALLPMIADTIRCLAMDGVQKARSGHPGMPMGCADFAALLWGRILKYNPRDPSWPDRDRFVLSAGHGSMLLYSALHLACYDLTLEDLKAFRQWGSRTPGHPEVGCAPGVETTTGPLGQGFGNGVGMAIAEAMLSEIFNKDGLKIVDHFTYGIVSDGDLMEGVGAEAASLAGHLKLGKLIYFYDDNHITIDGPTELSYSDDAARRFEGYHWHVQSVDGHDTAAMEQALLNARREVERPSLIIGRTHIAKGAPNKQDTADAHGAPLGEEEIRLTKERMGWPADKPFHIPLEVKTYFEERAGALAGVQEEWQSRFNELERRHPELVQKWRDFMEGRIPSDLAALAPEFDAGKSHATRNASGAVLNRLAESMENLVGGSADLAPSNKTLLKNSDTIGPGRFKGRNFHFGVREHGMGAVLNGLFLHGGFRPYGGTFLVFSDYMRPSIRIAALSGIPVIYVFTHDSIFVGEDGPTHQPVEHLAALRAIPDLVVLRPADARETFEAWCIALRRRNGPTALILSRQNLPLLEKETFGELEVERGAYCLKRERGDRPEVILMGTGSEVHVALEAAAVLEKEGRSVRVVSMPSFELFEAQPKAYQEEILPSGCTARVAVEAGVTFGWERFTGSRGLILGIDRFGASAPYEVLGEKFGFTSDRVLEAARSLLEVSRKRS